MKTALKVDLKTKTYCISKGFSRMPEKEVSLINFKFYQKLLIAFISLSTILIFPESPKEMENICEAHNSIELCNVW